MYNLLISFPFSISQFFQFLEKIGKRDIKRYKIRESRIKYKYKVINKNKKRNNDRVQ